VSEFAMDSITFCGSQGSARFQFSILKGSAALLRGIDYHGLRKLCRFISPFFPAENSAIVEVKGWRYRVYLRDDYWVRYALFGFSYEAEVASVLDELLDCRAVFLDCGANIGYWSVYAGTKIGSKDRVVAVEPSESTFVHLLENSELNGRSFSVVRKAVYSRSGEILEFRVDPARHDSNGIIPHGLGGARGYRSEQVDSITLDDLFEGVPIPADGVSNIVVKLDVEGAEREAFQGAQRLIGRGAVFIYEDHGSDSTCGSTEFALNVCGLEVYFLQSGMQPVRIRDLKQLAALKTCPTRGYNLVAAKGDSPPMRRLMEGLSARTRNDSLEYASDVRDVGGRIGDRRYHGAAKGWCESGDAKVQTREGG
jgi:FkbM family methyltransferase